MSGGVTETSFHLAGMQGLEHLVSALQGTTLDPTGPLYRKVDGSAYHHEPSLFTTGAAPRALSAESGLGATLQLSDGSELIDMCSMTENTVLGINDPWVKLCQVSHVLSERPHYVTVRFGSDLYYRVANRLSRHVRRKSGKDYVLNMRECTGSGAVELALHAAWKAAANCTRRRKLASFAGAFHGSNLGGVLVSDHQPERGSGRVLVERADNVEQFPIPELADDEQLTATTLDTLATLERDGDQYFAVMVEPISWRNAVHVVPTEFLRRLREICDAKAICLIFDEVQNGFGFTGTISYSEVCGVSPDISVLGKGLTSGHGTLAIIVADRQFGTIESPFGFKSNSANMLSLVAVDAVLDRLLGVQSSEAKSLPQWLPRELARDLEEGLLSSAYPLAVSRIDEMILELRRRFPSIVGVATGLGLMRGLVMLDVDGRPSSSLAREVAVRCTEFGVHVRQASTALYLKPCMVITQSEVRRALDALTETLTAVSGLTHDVG